MVGSRLGAGVLLAMGVVVFCQQSRAGVIITDADFQTTAPGTGNGVLDLKLFLDAGGGGVAGNTTGSFNGDDANIGLPSGGSSDNFKGSYITSIKELRDFYRLNGFTSAEIVVAVDINQTGKNQDIVLEDLRLIKNFDPFSPSTDPRNDPVNNDVSSDSQGATLDLFTGGTLLASVDPAILPKTLLLPSQGAGHGDYYINTHINPFDSSFSDSDRILFYWKSSNHNDGGETIFLIGNVVPEPGAVLPLLGVGLMLVGRRRRA